MTGDAEPPVAPSPSRPAEASGPALPRRPLAGPARALLVIAVAAAAAALFWPRGAHEREIRPGGFLVDANGRPQPLVRELKPVTLVHFWATWCPPCLGEIPDLLAFARQARDERFGLVLVAVADDPDGARRFVGDAEFPLLFDPGWDVAHRFATEKLPETHLVVGGRVVESFIGATDWADPAIRARVQKWSATPPKASP